MPQVLPLSNVKVRHQNAKALDQMWCDASNQVAAPAIHQTVHQEHVVLSAQAGEVETVLPNQSAMG